MKQFVVGDVFRGRSHADLINNTLGTRYKSFQQCSLELKDFDAQDVYAWFIFMDGTTHGYEDGWLWKNLLTDNGNIIREVNIDAKNNLYKKRAEFGYRPYRLAFQLDPYEANNRYCCKFVGAFRLSRFLNLEMTQVEYEKIADEIAIDSIGDSYNEIHLTKQDFIKDSSIYKTEIDKLCFFESTLKKLKTWGINTVADLLELPDGNCSIATEIREKLYNFLKDWN